MTRVPGTASRPAVDNQQLRQAHEKINQLVVAGRLTMVLSGSPIADRDVLRHQTNG
jgi:hypothetical protein